MRAKGEEIRKDFSMVFSMNLVTLKTFIRKCTVMLEFLKIKNHILSGSYEQTLLTVVS